MKTLIIALSIAFMLTSCDTTRNQTITRENIEASVLKLKEKQDLDSAKLEILDNILLLSKGRDEYMRAKFKDTDNKTLEKYIINNETFNENADNLFKYFNDNKVTYASLLTEIDTLNAINNKYDIKLAEVNKTIDEFCLKKQAEIDDREKNAAIIKDSLNRMVDLKILSIRETEQNYRDVVQVAIQMTNKTNKKIEAISFSLELTDKLGTKLATLGCRSNDGFLKSDVGYWTYDRWENDEIYKGLRNMNVSHVTSKQEVTRLNLAGKLITAYPDEDNYIFNADYKTPKKLGGNCPYLEKDDELNKSIESEKEKMSAEIKDKLRAVSKYQEMIRKIFNF